MLRRAHVKAESHLTYFRIARDAYCFGAGWRKSVINVICDILYIHICIQPSLLLSMKDFYITICYKQEC